MMRSPVFVCIYFFVTTLWSFLLMLWFDCTERSRKGYVKFSPTDFYWNLAVSSSFQRVGFVLWKIVNNELSYSALDIHILLSPSVLHRCSYIWINESFLSCLQERKAVIVEATLTLSVLCGFFVAEEEECVGYSLELGLASLVLHLQQELWSHFMRLSSMFFTERDERRKTPDFHFPDTALPLWW